METFRADLHCHSTYSDGSYTPEELIDLAKQKGLSGLSITDHDTVEAYETALSYAQREQIELIPGAEFSAQHHGVSVHILGYGFSLDNPQLQAFCQKHQERRSKRHKKILELLAAEGISITEEELFRISPKGSVGRPHIAQALLEKGYAKTIKDALSRYLIEGQPAYVKGEPFSAEDTLEVIHRAGGLAVVAHPHLIRPSTASKTLLKLNFDGLEGYYARFDLQANQRWLDIANNRGWLITGGSDFHGEGKAHINLGCSWTNEATFRSLQNLSTSEHAS